MDLFNKIVGRKSRSKSPVKKESTRNQQFPTPISASYSQQAAHQISPNHIPNGRFSHSTHSRVNPKNYPNATPMRHGERGERGEHYPVPEYPPVCYLPLPPSPLFVSRNTSGNSNASAESVQTWNSEKNAEESSFFLNGTHTPTQPGEFGGFLDSAPQSPVQSSGYRARSHSPQKRHDIPSQYNEMARIASRSKSPQKKKAVARTLDYLNSQCHLEGCSATVVVDATKFLVCKHQLSHASEYFRNVFNAEGGQNEVNVVVSDMSVPSPATQFRWFLESSVPCPGLKDISDETLETCMRLSKRFQAIGLEARCNKYIHQNALSRQPIVALCWLNWCLKHRFDLQVQQSCMPAVARLSLTSLEQHRHMLTEKLFGDLLAAKLRACYDKAVSVFQTIHKMDHFTCELPQCPRCGRTKDHMKVRVLANPCR
ncbi:unnamed protein product, partial [Mesorhabditis belari]